MAVSVGPGRLSVLGCASGMTWRGLVERFRERSRGRRGNPVGNADADGRSQLGSGAEFRGGSQVGRGPQSGGGSQARNGPKLGGESQGVGGARFSGGGPSLGRGMRLERDGVDGAPDSSRDGAAAADALGGEMGLDGVPRARFESLMRLPVTRWFLAVPLWGRIAGAGALAAGCGALVLVPAWVRHEVRSRCEERQLSCEVGAVRFGLMRLWLRGVAVEDRALPLLRARLNSVEVRPVWFGIALRVHGGRIEASATEEALRSRLRELGFGQKRSGSSERTGTGPERRRLEVDGIDVALRDSASGRGFTAWGLRAQRSDERSGERSDERGGERSGGGWFVAGDVIDVTDRRVRARLRGVELTTTAKEGESRRIERLDVASAAIHVALPEAAPDVEESAPAPSALKERKPKRGSVAAARPAVAPVSAAPVPDESARSALLWAALRPALSSTTADRFKATVVALTLEAHRGAESLRFGPSRFAVQREPEAFSLELVPLPQGGRTEATPLTVRLRLPLAEAKPELDLSGGPISLAALGVREGDFGLVGVRDARLEASLHASLGEGDAGFDVTSHGLLENVRVRRAALGPNELSGIRLGWQLQGGFKGGEVRLEQAELSLGDVRLRLAGTASRDPEHTTVNLRAEVPQAACGALLSAVPHGMAPMLESLRVEGTLSLRAKVDFDSAHVDATRINLDVSNQCRITGVPAAISPNRFRDAWWREVKGADGLPMTIQSGPGSPDWTAYEEISPYLETAILVCEDAGFFAHRGIDYRAIENSIRMNLEAGRFLRGGSTVTMQLAKNLYLSKEKTISRKFQEAVFTHLLEQELSKHELMELYLNVIEFGPGIYGVRQAARYYFNEEPRDLSLGQALYLASILPAPDTQHFAADGHVKDGWAGYLRKLMHIARKIRRITDEELQAGLAEQVAFRKPSERVGALGVAEDADDAPDDDDREGRDERPDAPAAP